MLTTLKQALRGLLKTPGFTVTALATLALCLGASLTIFAVVDAILLRSLPYPHAEKLVTLYYTYPRLPSASNGASLTTYYERRGKIPALASLAAISEATSVVGETGGTSIENVGRVTSEFFSTLGVTPFLGRAFKDEEMTYNSDHEAILSYEYWQSHYNADPGILGKSIRMDGLSRVIVGVLPPHFQFLSFSAPIYGPLSSEEGERNIGARHSLGTIQIGRIAPGATMADVQAQIDANDAAHAPEFPEAKIVSDAGCHTIVASLHADHVASVRPMLLLLQAGSVCLLLIGTVNLINLLLIRASGRTRELAIRQALGAGKRQVIRDVLSETMVLTVTGGLLGLLVGAAGIRLLMSLGAAQLPLGSQITFDGRVAIVALAGAVVIGLAIGLPIVWFTLRSSLGQVLQSESRGSTASRGTHRLRHGFIVAQIALAFILLTGAGLLGLSLKRAMAVQPGFRVDHIMTGRFSLTWNGYPSLPSFQRFFDRLYEKSRALPGVSAVGVISNVPVSGDRENDVITVPGYTMQGSQFTVHDFFGVAGDYFNAMGIPLLAGRYLNEADANSGLQVCVVDANLAKQYWPHESAVGKEIYRGTNPGQDQKPSIVVGVVGSVKQAGLTETNPKGALYFPYNRSFNRNYYIVARTQLMPESFATLLTKVVREVDPEVPLTDLRSMEVRIDDSLTTRRSPALMAGIFAATALALAMIGLYGVMAYTVVQRTGEFGIRMALGAQQRDVVWLVFKLGVRLAAIGVGVGCLVTLLLTSYMDSLLYGVKPDDPRAFTGVAVLLAAVATIACVVPALRATKVDPVIALRGD